MKRQNQIDNYALLKLFKAVSGKYTGISERALRAGIAMPNCPEEIVTAAINFYGRSDIDLYNATFHKSFDVVKRTSEFTLLMQQLLHYFTTYGTNFTSDYVYIPAEQLNVPTLAVDKIRLVTIKTLGVKEIFENIIQLSKIALSNDTVDSLMQLIDSMESEMPDVLHQVYSKVTNRELLCRLYLRFGDVPSNPNEMLRFMIYIATGNALKINNRKTIRNIKNGLTSEENRKQIKSALETYDERFGLFDLAVIFPTNKNLFLAFKTPETAAYFNKLNKLSKTYNARSLRRKNAMFRPVIDHLTDTTYPVYGSNITDALNRVTVQREIAVLNALSYYTTEPDYAEYKIRNGKKFVKELNASGTNNSKNFSQLETRRGIVMDHLKNRLAENFKGKKFVIPGGLDCEINYGLPLSEKNFIGSIPENTRITVPIFKVPGVNKTKAFVVAICWKVECDLDLSVIDDNGYKVGWNGNLKSKNGKMLFSGDMTCLVDGKACEAVYVEGTQAANVSVNLYANRSGSSKIPFKFIIAKVDPLKSYMPQKSEFVIDPNTIVASIDLELDSNRERQMDLGLFHSNGNGFTYVFQKISAGDSCVSRFNEWAAKSIQINQAKQLANLSLNNIITACGGTILEHEPKRGEFIDLSFENLSKETLVKLLAPPV